MSRFLLLFSFSFPMDTLIWLKNYCDRLALCTNNDERAEIVNEIYADGMKDGQDDGLNMAKEQYGRC